jgi:ABC-2 type transport system ATP-binding protein
MDAAARRTAWELLRGLRQEGTCILLTTHLLAEAEELADRVAIIDRGRLVALGTPAELRSADVTDETTTDLSLPGRPSRSQRARREIRLELRTPLPAAREARLGRLAGVVRIRTTRPGVYQLSTDSPTELLMELSAWLWALGIEPLGIQLGQASLEDVFLRLVGEREQP